MSRRKSPRGFGGSRADERRGRGGPGRVSGRGHGSKRVCRRRRTHGTEANFAGETASTGCIRTRCKEYLEHVSPASAPPCGGATTKDGWRAFTRESGDEMLEEALRASHRNTLALS